MTREQGHERKRPKRESREPAISPAAEAPRDAESVSDARSAVFVIDRREGDMIILENDAGTTIDVEARHLPRGCRAEGAALRVELAPDGSPLWADAVRDRAEERRRQSDASKRIERLRRSDPGGDVDL